MRYVLTASPIYVDGTTGDVRKELTMPTLDTARFAAFIEQSAKDLLFTVEDGAACDAIDFTLSVVRP